MIGNHSKTKLNFNTLSHSHSDTNLVLTLKKEQNFKSNVETESNESTQPKKKPKAKRYHSREVRLGIMLSKEKKRLKDYIENNSKYVKLFGNKRYKDNSPYLYVQDVKKKLDDKKSGLIPVPNKSRKKIKSAEEEKELYELQRSIVMIRRYMYNHKIGQDLYYLDKNNIIDFLQLQKWWKYTQKIVMIQKVVRGWLVRKNYFEVRNFGNYLKNLEIHVLFALARKAFDKIFALTAVKKEIVSIGKVIKQSKIISHKVIMKIILIQSKYRQLKTKKKFISYLKRISKLIPKSNFLFIRKVTYDQQKLLDYLKRIVNIWRKYDLRRKLIIKKRCLPLIMKKSHVSRPTSAAKMIQGWIKRHHYFVCNDKKESVSVPKEQTWNYFTRDLIDKKMQEKAFIKPKPPIKDNHIKAYYFYTKEPCFLSKKRSISIHKEIQIIQRNMKRIFIMKRPNEYKEQMSLVDKCYLNIYNQRILKFNILMRNVYINHFFKKHIKYVPSNKYSDKEIHTIRKIQLKYIKHLYGKNNNKKKTINDMKYYISKERLIDVYKNIPIIQKKTKKYLSHKNRFDVNKVDNKPLIDICYIKKQYISNAFEALLRVQQKIKSFLIIKRIKRENDSIKGKRIYKQNIQSFTTKEIRSFYQTEIDSIKQLQSYLHKRYKDISSNSLLLYQKGQLCNKTPVANVYNKKPLYDNVKWFITKKRIELSYGEVYSTNYNRPIKLTYKSVCFLTKKSLYTNDKAITLLQKNIRLFQIKPIKRSSSSSSNYQSELFDVNVNSSVGFITKERKRIDNQRVEEIQKKYKVFKSKRNIKSNNKEVSKEYYDNKKKGVNVSCYISKIRVFNNTLKQSHHYIDERKNVIKLCYEYKDIDSTKSLCKEINYISKERKQNNVNSISLIQRNIKNSIFKTRAIVKKPAQDKDELILDNKVNIKGICSITKKRKEEFSNYIKKILEIQKLIKDYLINKKEKIRNLNDTKNIITKPIAIVCSLIDKERHTDYISKIVLIQNEYKNKLSEVQRKEQISVLSYPTKKTPCYIDKKTKYIYHNLPKNESMCYTTKKSKESIHSKISKILTIQRNIKRFVHKSERNKAFISNNSISHNNLNILYEKPSNTINKYNIIDSYITKKNYRTIPQQKNLCFINLLCILATKSIQEFVFSFLKTGESPSSSSSSFYKNIKRLYYYYKDSSENNSKATQVISLIISKNKSNTFNTFLSSLTSKDLKLLHNSIYSSFEDDLLSFLSSFSLYDKSFSNPHLLSHRIKHSNINNTNIFSLINYIDTEFSNVLNGTICPKCYNSNDHCTCHKVKFDDNNITEDEDDIFDELTAKSNRIEYDSIRCGGKAINRRPKIVEEYEDPITHLYTDSLTSNTINLQSEDAKNYDSNATFDMMSTYDSNKKEISSFKKMIHENTRNRKNNVIIRNSSSQSNN